MVDHMKLFEGGSNDYIFGTTRTYMDSGSVGTFTQAHIFRVKLISSDHKIDTSSGLLVSKLSSGSLGTDSYVTGISNSLENSDKEFHLTIFDPTNKKLYYMKPNFD